MVSERGHCDTARDLQALGDDQRVREMPDHVPPLSMPRAFGVACDEIGHSRALDQ